jgi:hypothetical protein
MVLYGGDGGEASAMNMEEGVEERLGEEVP